MFALFAVLLGLPQGVEADELRGGHDEGERPAIARCVLEAPDRIRLLQTLEGGIVLATHPCNGGLYLIPNEVDSADTEPGAMARATTLHEGWWLYELNAATWVGHGTIEVCGRFITGIGPNAATPFSARIRVRRQPGGWQAEEPVLTDEPAGQSPDGDGTCNTEGQVPS